MIRVYSIIPTKHPGYIAILLVYATILPLVVTSHVDPRFAGEIHAKITMVQATLVRDAHQDIAHNGSSPQQASAEVGTNAACAGQSGAPDFTIKHIDLR